MPKSIHYTAAVITVLLCAPLLAFSETYFDCLKSGESILYRAEPCDKGEQKSPNVSVDQPDSDSGDKESVEITAPNQIDVLRANNGIYQVPGSINGHTVLFTVDTGASHLSISTQDAEDYGVVGCLPGKSATANGVVDTCMATASAITFGGFSLNDVFVTVVPNLVGNPLLGMNILSKFKIEQINGVMRIYKH